jgi:hypothetical protein
VVINSAFAADLYCSQINTPGLCVVDRIVSVASADDAINVVGQASNFIDTQTAYAAFSESSQFSFFPKKVFTTFPSLYSITLNNNSLVNMETNTFDNCASIDNLQISNELFTNLPAGFAQNCRNMTKLYIDYNELSTLDANALTGLTSLTQISMTYNKIFCIPPGFFANALALHVVQLANNQITALDPLIFKGLANLYIAQLEVNNISFIPNLDLTGTAISEKTIGVAITIHNNPIIAIYPQLFETVFPSRTKPLFFDGGSRSFRPSSPLVTCHSNETWQVSVDNWNSVKSSFTQCFNNWTPAMASYVISCGVTTTTSTTIPTTTSLKTTEETTTSKLPTTAAPSSCPACNPPPTTPSPYSPLRVLEVILSVIRNLTLDINFH